MIFIRPDGKRVIEDAVYVFDTWIELVESENEETYPLTENELKELIGKDIWQLPDGKYVWDVSNGLFIY